MASDRDLFGTGGASARKAKPGKGAKAAEPRKGGTPNEAGYTAASIEVLEGLEPVRRRPGMYIGGTDEAALHHLFAEVIDNSMDEALAGHATWIEVELEKNGFVTVNDNGRGIPVDIHPVKKKSALELVMTVIGAASGEGLLIGAVAVRVKHCRPFTITGDAISFEIGHMVGHGCRSEALTLMTGNPAFDRHPSR